MQYRPVRFPTGEVRATMAALANVSKEKLIRLVNRHIRGDWGDTCMADQKANEQAIRDGDRILSWYDRLSLSEKIRAGMEVSELMKRLTGRNYPVFVDNMESVDDLANVHPTGQIIMAKCVSNAPLQVRPIKPIVFAEQRAA